MNEEPYSNREIREMFEALGDKLDRIEAQTTKTNGSVAALKDWKQFQTGFVYAMGLFMTLVIVPLLGATLYRVYVVYPEQQKTELQAAVMTALDKYTINP